MRPPDSEIRSRILDRFTPRAEEAPPAPGAAPVPRVAVIVVHGMGQQVRYETLAATADVLQRAQHRANGVRPEFSSYLSADGDDFVPRLEARLESSEGHPHEVHLYEVYWAPITVGRIRTPETFSFLLASAWDAVVRRARHTFSPRTPWTERLSGRSFSRYIFEQWRDLPVSALTQAGLTIAVFVLVLLAAMNAVVLAAAASRTLTWNRGGWPSGPLLQDLTLDFLTLVAGVGVSLLLGVVLPKLGRDGGRPRGEPRRVARPLTALSWVFVLLALLTVVVAGAFVVSHLVRHAAPGVSPQWAGTPLWSLVGGLSQSPATPGSLALMLVVWGLVLGLAWLARRFLRLFVGDVAIYVSAHSANRFYQAREAIQREATHVARHVYDLRDHDEYGDERPYYERVLFVGHSLGSVIAYDTLNAMIRRQLYANADHQILERTRGLVTFGSPLDKTAYIFRGQAREDFALREVLAATWQPLIRKYRYRPPSWINIWSRHDPISGSLDYYDDPEETLGPDRAKRVENREDPDATTPVLAHNEYWDGHLLGEVLLEEITCDDALPEFLA